MDSTTDAAQPKVLDGYIQILTTPTIFEMDLVGKNLQMNGIEAVWFYPDTDELSSLFVRHNQKENALSILSSLDLTDFTTHNG
jgi:hypothetical protein